MENAPSASQLSETSSSVEFRTDSEKKDEEYRSEISKFLNKNSRIVDSYRFSTNTNSSGGDTVVPKTFAKFTKMAEASARRNRKIQEQKELKKNKKIGSKPDNTTHSINLEPNVKEKPTGGETSTMTMAELVDSEDVDEVPKKSEIETDSEEESFGGFPSKKAMIAARRELSERMEKLKNDKKRGSKPMNTIFINLKPNGKVTAKSEASTMTPAEPVDSEDDVDIPKESEIKMPSEEQSSSCSEEISEPETGYSIIVTSLCRIMAGISDEKDMMKMSNWRVRIIKNNVEVTEVFLCPKRLHFVNGESAIRFLEPVAGEPPGEELYEKVKKMMSAPGMSLELTPIGKRSNESERCSCSKEPTAESRFEKMAEAAAKRNQKIQDKKFGKKNKKGNPHIPVGTENPLRQFLRQAGIDYTNWTEEQWQEYSKGPSIRIPAPKNMQSALDSLPEGKTLMKAEDGFKLLKQMLGSQLEEVDDVDELIRTLDYGTKKDTAPTTVVTEQCQSSTVSDSSTVADTVTPLTVINEEPSQPTVATTVIQPTVIKESGETATVSASPSVATTASEEPRKIAKACRRVSTVPTTVTPSAMWRKVQATLSSSSLDALTIAQEPTTATQIKSMESNQVATVLTTVPTPTVTIKEPCQVATVSQEPTVSSSESTVTSQVATVPQDCPSTCNEELNQVATVPHRTSTVEPPTISLAVAPPPSSTVSKSSTVNQPKINCSSCFQNIQIAKKAQNELKLAQAKANSFEKKAMKTDDLQKEIEKLEGKYKNANDYREKEKIEKEMAQKEAKQNKEKAMKTENLEEKLKNMEKEMKEMRRKLAGQAQCSQKLEKLEEKFEKKNKVEEKLRESKKELTVENELLKQEILKLKEQLEQKNGETSLETPPPSTTPSESEPSTLSSSSETGLPCTICLQVRHPWQVQIWCQSCPIVFHLECLQRWYEKPGVCQKCPNCTNPLIDPEAFPALGSR